MQLDAETAEWKGVGSVVAIGECYTPEWYVVRLGSGAGSYYMADDECETPLLQLPFRPAAFATSPDQERMFIAGAHGELETVGIDNARGTAQALWQGSHPFSGSFIADLVADPTKRFVYVASGPNYDWYSIDSGGAWTYRGTAAAVGLFPMVFDPQGNNAYWNGTWLKVDQDSGELSFAGTFGGSSVIPATIDPAGRYLFNINFWQDSTGRRHSDLVVFSLQPSGEPRRVYDLKDTIYYLPTAVRVP